LTKNPKIPLKTPKTLKIDEKDPKFWENLENTPKNLKKPPKSAQKDPQNGAVYIRGGG